MYIDSHAHLDDKRFDQDREDLIQGLASKGVSAVICPGSDLETSKACLELAKRHSTIYAALGIHPHEAKEAEADYLDKLKSYAENDRVVAIGEIGLDYYYEHSPKDIQKDVFIEQIQLAWDLDLPIIIHNRESHGDMLDILREYKDRIRGGVMHCYSGSWEMAKVLLDLGFYISLGGPVTFKNARRSVEVAENIPLDRLLIETDSPYLTPVPHRGKRNNPGFLPFVAERIAEIRDMDVEEIGRITFNNTVKLFKLSDLKI